MEWQPIETAPRDGTWFLGFMERQTLEDTIRVWAWMPWKGCDTPMFYDAADTIEDEQPTHWMPLPPAPEATP